MPIENRDLAVGTVLTARYKKQDRTCEVVETPDGVRYRLDDGTEHRSPSSAGKAAMDGVACNGWRFWSVQGTEPARREPRGEDREAGEDHEGEAREEGARQEEGREEVEGQGAAGGVEERFVRLRRVPRNVPDDEGGDQARDDAQRQLIRLARSAEADSARSLLSFMQRLPIVPAQPSGDTTIKLRWEDRVVSFSDLAQRALEWEPDADLDATRWRDGADASNSQQPRFATRGG